MKHYLFVFAFLIIGFLSFSQTAKVIGYLPEYRFSLSDKVEYCKLTHLNLSFANPDASGNILMADISEVVSDAQEANPDIIICISLAGGVLSEEQAKNWSDLIDIPANRPAFITKIVDYVLDNDLDGVDVDLEWGNVTKGYSDFVMELNDALDFYDLLMTAALPNQTLFSEITKEALAVFDIINIMAYDATGSWDPSNSGQHSSYDFAKNGIKFWKNAAKDDGGRITLGVPFYGYDFVSATSATEFSYADMVNADESYAELDEVGAAYYNGRPTIEKKVELANDEVGGIMIWEMGQDHYSEYSLLSTIHAKYTSLGVKTTGMCGNDVTTGLSIEPESELTIYPNPASDCFSIKCDDNEKLTISISNALGQIIDVKETARNENSNDLYYNTSKFKRGIYFITVKREGSVAEIHKLVVN